MINPRKVATLGIGFSLLSISAIGLIADVPKVNEVAFRYFAAGSSVGFRHTVERGKQSIKLPMMLEEDDEEAVVLFVISEAIKLGVI